MLLKVVTLVEIDPMFKTLNYNKYDNMKKLDIYSNCSTVVGFLYHNGVTT